MQNVLEAAAEQFQIHGRFQNAQSYGSGHVNDTYLVTFTQNAALARYIFQKINKNIFRDIDALMQNIVRVTAHIKNKLMEKGLSDIGRRVLTVIPARDSCSYYRDARGDCWRAYLFIENARTYDVPDSAARIYEAARAFGLFQKMLVDLPMPPLNETIPDFHNGKKRFEAFRCALEADACNRAKDAKPEIDFLLNNSPVFDVPPPLVKNHRLPLRTTHNDTKVNNVMLDDKTGQGLCVIDLDTVMSGLPLHDFGDIVRTAVSPAAEDEMDLSKVSVDMKRFEAIARGYLSAADFLTAAEREYLVFGGIFITLEQFARFLTDYLMGDVYYKTSREKHNLDRSRTQLKLVQSIKLRQEQMNRLVEKIWLKEPTHPG
jgi:hypothetical protein